MYPTSTKQSQITNQETTKSKKVSFTRVVFSSVVMNLQIAKRYKANLIGGILEMAVISFVFALFAGAMQFKSSDFSSFTSDQIFIFFMGAILIIVFNSTGLWTPANTVNRDLYNGVLEYLYFNPSNRFAYFLGSVLADGLLNFVFLFVPLFSVTVLIININLEAIIGILVVSILVLITLMSLGIVISFAVILWKDVRGLIGILGLLFQFLSGAFFPVQTFPEPVQWLAYLLPFTFGFDAVRWFSFEGSWTTIFPIEIEMMILIFYAIVYLSISIILLGKVEAHAKTKGLHLI